MPQIRELVRYIVPGYMVLIYLFLLLFPFFKAETISTFDVFKVAQIVLSGLVLALPLGYISFQLYQPFYYWHAFRWVWKRPLAILQKWATELECDEFGEKFKNISKTEKYAILEVSLFTRKRKETLEFSLGYRSLLSTFWAHLSSRLVLAFFVPLLSSILFVIILLSSWYSPTIQEFFVFAWEPLLRFPSWLLIIFLSILFLLKIGRIQDEIGWLESYVLLLNEDWVKQFMQILKKAYQKELQGAI